MMIQKQLAKTLNLTQLEHCILEYLSEARSIQQIAKETGYSRTGVKYALLSIKDKGFIRKIKYGKRYLYISITIEELSKKIQDMVDELSSCGNSSKGIKIRTSKRDEFIIHIGKEEILPAYSRIASMNKNERIKAIQHHRSWVQLSDKITPKQLVDFNNNIIKNKIILDGMLNEGAYESYKDEIIANPKKHEEAIKSLDGRMADYTVFPDNFFNYDTEMWLFKNTVLMINWEEEIAVEITNKNITSFLLDMFRFVKMGGRKIDHNRLLREVL